MENDKTFNKRLEKNMPHAAEKHTVRSSSKNTAMSLVGYKKSKIQHPAEGRMIGWGR